MYSLCCWRIGGECVQFVLLENRRGVRTVCVAGE